MLEAHNADVRKIDSPIEMHLFNGIICQSVQIAGYCIMPTRNVVLTDRQAELVERLVREGRYQNASEVMREGLRLVEDKEEDAKARLKALREAARIGIADIDSGHYRTFESAADVNRHLGSVRDRALAKKPAR